MTQTVTVPGVGDLDFPDGMSQPDMAAAIQRNFPQIHSGGAAPADPQAAAPAPSVADSVVSTIKSAASSVADAASSVAGWLKPAISGLAHSSEASESPLATSTLPEPAPAPAPLSHADMIDAASAGGIPVGPPAPATKAVIPHTEAVAVDQAAARRKAWDDVPQGTLQAGYNAAAGQAGKTLANLMSTAGEVTDTEGLRTLGRQYQAAADARINRAMQGNEDSDAVKTVAGVFSLAPLVAGPAGLSAMVTQAGVDGYSDARQAGDSPGEAVSRGTAMALANYVGLRTQLPGLTGALTKAVSGAPAGQAIAALGHALTTNVGGMEATTVLGDLYDKMAPGGLKPNMSADDMLHDIAATAKSATLLTLAVPGVPLAAGHLFHAAHSLAHGDGSAAAASAIDSATPPPADATPTTAADNTAPAPIGLDTLHDSIDETAKAVGLSPAATVALREAAAQRDPQDAAAFVARAFHRYEANGLTTKPGAPGAFRDTLAQRIADQQPEPAPAAPAKKASAAPSVADQFAAIRPLDAAPAPAESAPPAEPTPITPEGMAQANDIAAAAHDAATSPFNDTPEPTDAQKAAGNYKLGHVDFQGMKVSIENPQGSVRSGVDPDGKPWSNEMAAHYGYLAGTRANDGDHVDTFIGPNPESKTAYVIDQVDPATGKFDEPKTILGADSEQQARELYAANYADGWNGLGAITALPMDAFKAWVRDGVKSKPLGDISNWTTHELSQLDLAKPADLAPGTGDAGGSPAVAGGGDSRPDPAVASGRDLGGDATPPAGSPGAADAVGSGGGADAALKAPEPAQRLLGKPVDQWADEKLAKIVDSTAATARARDVARTELTRRTTGTPEFKKWFGDSKVVDENGEPQVMFHGTSKSEDGDAFSAFDSYASEHGLFGQGSYFTEDPKIASDYTTKGKGKSPTVYPVHLSIKNPIDMDAPADPARWREAYPDQDLDAFHEGGATNESWFRAAEDAIRDEQVPKWEGAEMMQDGLRKMGYDGITHIGGGRIKGDSTKHRVFIAFDPEQVKSAIGNRGTFDPASADIRTKQSTEPVRAGIDPAALHSEVTRIQAGWKDAPPVHVVDDVAGLPAHIQDSLRSMGAEGKTRALLMPGKGSDPGDVYLIASRLKDIPTAQQALFHEVLGHYGIRKVLGSDATYFAEMYKLRQANPALASEAEAWMQAHGRGAIADRMSRGLSQDAAMKVVRALSTEEALADRAGKGEPIRGLQSLMAKIQTWLRSVGLDHVADHLEKMTQAETAALLARARRTVEATGPTEEHAGELAPALSESDSPALSQRDDAPTDLPDAVIGHPLAAATTHPDYAAAKGGDPVAAHRLAEDLVTPDFAESVRKTAGAGDVIVQPVVSVEASGRNKIPRAVAEVLAERLGGEAGKGIVQSNSPKRTAMDGLDRVLSSPEFDGPVRTDKPYVLLDDTLTQGGTMAALASHIRQNGGKVAAVATLTGKGYSRVLKLSPETLGQVRDRYASVEPDFRAATGRGFDSLTQSEARYLAQRSNPAEVRDRIIEAGRRARLGDDPEADRGAQSPLLSQHAADDAAAEPDAPRSHVADALAKVREAGAKFADTMKSIRDDALLKTVPMALGNAETRTVAKDFANADRLARWQWGKFDDVLTKNYDEAQRRDMFNASDEQSVLLQQGKKVGPDEGLNSLTPDERKTVETLQGYGNGLLERAKGAGMFEGEGIPSWTPRMAVMVDGRGGFSRPKGTGAETGAKQGRNIVTTASSLKARKYLTSAETEAAMKGKLGDGAQLVRDIRVMPLAMARLEKAIAGRELLNQIKEMGNRAGLETVSTSDKDGFFTVDHPAFKTWQATTAEDGTKSWEAKPLYVNKAFEGPLKAVMSETPGPVYSALMALKAKSMGLIMYSPLIHNAVEWGRALPAMPGKVATFQIYFEGNRIKNDPVQMRQAIADGLVPIGKRGGIQDITGIMEDPSLKPGRSWTAKLIGGALGLANEKAGTAVKKGIDKAGDFWHNTLLWDRVGDLQAGLYGAMREKEIAKGVDPAVAGKLAAHFANRFAGALPNEAMSAGARKVANLLMFSRTFTLGNMGLMKDMLTGLPRDVRSQIETASGELAAKAATSRARRIAIASFIVDIGMMYVGNSLMQDAFKKMKGDKTLGELGQGYLDRLHKLMQRTSDHPLATLSNPFDMMNSLSSTSENEPGKEDRIRVGTQDDGTAIYMRLPTGKVGEDFKNWITKPLVTAKAKESQLVRPLQQIWSNDNGIGRRIYDPDAEGLGGVLSNAGKIAKLFATQMIPADAIQGALDWKSGKASDVDKLKVVGPLAGLTFSKGAPGGPAVGQMYAADRKFEGAKMDVMPDVKAAIKDGDLEKAVALLDGIKMAPGEIRATLRHLEVPESRLSAGAFKRFSQHASDDDMARMMQLLQGEQPAASAAAQ